MLCYHLPIEIAVDRRRPRPTDEQHGCGKEDRARLPKLASPAVTLTNLIQLNPYGNGTVKIATKRSPAFGTLMRGTKAPVLHGYYAKSSSTSST